MENNKKETAIEWIVSTINDNIVYIPMKHWDLIRDIIQQAKEMEKEQITDAYNMGSYDMAEKKYEPEQYYNKKYGTE